MQLNGKSILAMLLSFFALFSCKKETISADYQVVPLPQKVEMQEGEPFKLNSATKIVYAQGNEKLRKTAEFLADYLKLSTGLTLTVTDASSSDNSILLQTGFTHENAEAYTITINTAQVVIKGASDAGVFYGVQTLRKSIPAQSKGMDVVLPQVTITDYPRFAYRGMMLDVGRHFFPVEFIKKYIDILALHNMNRFHWHLTDDQGWRIEIKKYPLLTEIGSKRSETLIGKGTGKFDGQPYGGFYTQAEAKEIVAYAEDRFITVIPEIDLPGHMLAALTAYPELGCTGGPYEVEKTWGVFDDVLCIGNEKTHEFIEDVFTELIDIFPSNKIHVGGDECPKTRWETCPKCQAKIKELGLKKDSEHSAEEKLQSYCISRAAKFLNSKGREIIGWEEILEGGVPEGATVMSWRGVEVGIEAAKLKRDVIMSPSTHLYFDYYQTLNIDNVPLAIGGYIPLERAYEFDPIPKELSIADQKYIIGVQANLWTEYILTSDQVEYMILPRAAALSEVQWSAPESKDYDKFLQRLLKLTKHYDLSGFNYAKHIFDIASKVTPNPAKEAVEVEMTTFDNAPIYYTLDGTEPTARSTKYEKPLEIKEALTLKAVAVRPNGESLVYTETFSINKATFKAIELKTQAPEVRYTFGGVSALVDGLVGGKGYSDGNWIGFLGEKVEVVIDLKKETDISSIKIGTFVSINDWIFGATGLIVSTSNDGTSFKEVVNKTYPEATATQELGRINLEETFSPENVRYLKVTIPKTAKLPSWHPGAGRDVFLFIDEIQVD